ncbi:MAG: hypothetical protein ACRDHP_11625, partial [Ktedonobacterales bacterium]
PGNRLSFCVEARATALPCVTKSATLAAAAHAVYLRVTRQAATYTGSYSADGQTWMDIGQWTAGVSTSRAATSTTATTSTPTPLASPTTTGVAGAGAQSHADAGAAPLGFTEAGLFVTTSTGALNLPVFTNYEANALAVTP